jgi:DNA polymerase-3 subunit alpha
MTEYYNFPCGCKFPIIGYGPNGIPRLEIPSEVANIPMDCARTWDMLSNGLTLGIFQLESKQCQGMARKLKPRSIAHLSALIAIIRPGVLEAMMDGKNMTNHYIDRKNMVEPVTYFHPSMENSLKNTYGICIYQEQIIQMVQDIAGFTLQDADLLRKSIGKKLPEVMAKCKTMFINGCKQANIVNESEAEQIFTWIEKSQRYNFNQSHSYSYAYNAYLSAYMKSHFPRAFYTSYLHHAQNQAKPFEEIRGLVRDARLQGVRVLGPDIRYLYKHFTLVDKNIRFGLVDIKGIGEKEYEKFLKNINTYCDKKSKKIDEISWLEFLLFISTKINSTMCTALIQGGALLYMGVSRTQMCFEYETFNKLSDREQAYIISSTSLDTNLNLTILAQLVQRVITAKIPNKTRMKVVEGIWRTLNTPPYSMVDSPAWIAQNEINLFGIALSCCGLEGCDINEASATCEDFLTQLDTQVFAIAVTLDEIKEIKTKNGKNPGQQMAFTTVSDNTGNMECVIFPDVWKEIRPIMFVGNNVLIYGERSKDKNSCIIKNAQQI